MEQVIAKINGTVWPTFFYCAVQGHFRGPSQEPCHRDGAGGHEDRCARNAGLVRASLDATGDGPTKVRRCLITECSDVAGFKERIEDFSSAVKFENGFREFPAKDVRSYARPLTEVF